MGGTIFLSLACISVLAVCLQCACSVLAVCLQIAAAGLRHSSADWVVTFLSDMREWALVMQPSVKRLRP